MNREEFLILAKSMRTVYNIPTFLADKESVAIWYDLLKDISYPIAAASLKRHMQTSNKLPTISDLRGGALKMTQNAALSDGEAWGLVSKAIRNSGYNSKAEFDALPAVIQKAVGSAEILHNWSQTDVASVETVIQSQFLRSYRAEVTRMERNAQLSPDLQALTQRTIQLLGEKECLSL